MERVTELEEIIKEKDRLIEELQARLDENMLSNMRQAGGIGGGNSGGSSSGAANSRTSLELDSNRSNSRKTTAYVTPAIV